MPHQKPIWRREYVIASKTAEGRRVLDELLGQLQRQDWPERDIFAVHLAVEEALVNAIVHGNRRQPDKRVRVTCHLSAQRLRVTVVDEGPGFDPACVPNPTAPDRLEAPSGRGVMLMRAFMTRVEYAAGGNEVTLEKQRAS